jgi:hypothetical protein
MELHVIFTPNQPPGPFDERVAIQQQRHAVAKGGRGRDASGVGIG